MVVKTYLRKHAKSGEAAEKLGEYQKILERIKEKLRLFSHPNVLPNQRLLLEAVFSGLRHPIERSYSHSPIFSF